MSLVRDHVVSDRDERQSQCPTGQPKIVQRPPGESEEAELEWPRRRQQRSAEARRGPYGAIRRWFATPTGQLQPEAKGEVRRVVGQGDWRPRPVMIGLT